MADKDVLADEAIEIEIGGRKYKCAPIGAVDRAALRARIREQRIEAVKRTCREFSAEVFSAAIAKAAAQPVTERELYEYMASEEGMLFLLWRGVQRFHPQVTFEHFKIICNRELLAVHSAAQFAASGYGPAPADNAHMPIPDADDDKQIALLMRYYGMSLKEASELSPKQAAKLIQQIADVKQMLGEIP